MIFGIFEAAEILEDGQLDAPTAGLIPGAFLALQEERSDVSEGSGAAGGEAVGGEGVEKFSENVVDVDLGDVVAGEAGNLGGEIIFARLRLGLSLGVAKVGEAEALAFGMGGKAALAAVGKGELSDGLALAKVVDIDIGEKIAKRYLAVKILVYIYRAHFILVYSNACGN